MKTDKRGKYMLKYTKEQRTTIMRERGKQKWASMSAEQQQEFIKKLSESRKKHA